MEWHRYVSPFTNSSLYIFQTQPSGWKECVIWFISNSTCSSRSWALLPIFQDKYEVTLTLLFARMQIKTKALQVNLISSELNVTMHGISSYVHSLTPLSWCLYTAQHYQRLPKYAFYKLKQMLRQTVKTCNEPPGCKMDK